jgi:hypothetical protein
MRFVAPDAVRIHLKNGSDWIEVKKELGNGDQQRLNTLGMRRVSGKKGDDETNNLEVDWVERSIGRALIYITDWSAKKAFTRDALEALCSEDFEEIDEAVKAHELALEQEKKARTTSATSTPPSQ